MAGLCVGVEEGEATEKSVCALCDRDHLHARGGGLHIGGAS